MTYTFTPPTKPNGYRYLPDSTPLQKRLYKYMSAAEVGQTVWIDADGSVHQQEDPYLTTLLTAAQVFQGGHIYEVDDATAATLTAAGYTLTAAGSAYGAGTYGSGTYGG